MATTAAALHVVPSGDALGDPWPDFWAAFMREMKAGTIRKGGKPISPATESTWNIGGDKYRAWCLQNGQATDPAEMTREQIIGYMEWLYTVYPSPNSVRNRMAPLKRFFRYCVQRGWLTTSPMEGISIPALVWGEGKFPEDAVFASLLKSCQCPPDEERSVDREFRDRRDEAMIRLFLDTGMRISAMASMSWDYSNIGEGWGVAYWKGQRWEIVRWEPQTSIALRRYYKVWERHPMHEARVTDKQKPDATVRPMWLTHKGVLAVGSIEDILDTRCKYAGVERFNPHQFRHRFGDQLHRSNLSTEQAKAMGNWRDSKAFDRYGYAKRKEALDEVRKRISLSGKF